MLRKIYFSYQINLTKGERPNKKNIESLNLTCKYLKALTWKILLAAFGFFFLVQFRYYLETMKVEFLKP